MVVPESEAASQGEVESPLQLQDLQAEQQQLQKNNNGLSSLGRQSSIYSLTLDEFQHTLCESGKNFGSMNMDEFLNSIWTAEENQAHAQNNPGGDNNTQRQVTFGEMTLEDFLVRAGVVQEQGNTAPIPARPQQYTAAMYPNNNTPAAIAPTYVARPVMGLGGGAVPAYQALPQGGVVEAPGYPKRGGGGYAQPSPPVYGGRMGNGSAVGYAHMQGLGLGSPVSPVSSDGLCVNPGGDGGNHYGLETGIRGGGRKRIIDGPVEKVVERRQRRMIKNRESAARSRARKQVYIVSVYVSVFQ
nr:protein ABSCISIC ACID-INSENSITIVE 5 [Ipomoea batatas]